MSGDVDTTPPDNRPPHQPRCDEIDLLSVTRHRLPETLPVVAGLHNPSKFIRVA